MSVAELVFIDTNILVYAHDRSETIKCPLARQVVLDAVRAGNAVISAQVLGEFFTTVTRKIAEPLSLLAARHELTLLARLRVIPLDSTLILRAIDMMSLHQTSYWDALILSAAELAGVKTLLSEDFNAGQNYGGIRVVNPFA
ncbi:MAG: PIN domain-containing protein [Kiritimatiellae bacterium]|nr:PIN domain-containing protein [Kiritimatiellia bacterium]MDD3544596.1 PIN domain-containing protein [Kiritimatiellia bacterium]MDD4025338.1 PIN domain-containing protein [Kiritimatiellia bacterium]MDD4622503.1 PIN domain-containing protein [Kiritimatiellia bacterium]